VALLSQEGLPASRVEAVERFAFYEKIKGASVIVQSGEATAYGNAMFCKGVIL
jgi:L-fucose mutarotase